MKWKGIWSVTGLDIINGFPSNRFIIPAKWKKQLTNLNTIRYMKKKSFMIYAKFVVKKRYAVIHAVSHNIKWI